MTRMNEFKGLPPRLSKTLLKLPQLLPRLKEQLAKISRNPGGTPATHTAEDIEASIGEIINGVLDKLKELGWNDQEIFGKSKNPADMSLTQVLRPGCIIVAMSGDTVIFNTATGARLRHERKSIRLSEEKQGRDSARSQSKDA